MRNLARLVKNFHVCSGFVQLLLLIENMAHVNKFPRLLFIERDLRLRWMLYR